jgi:hypothetical protein
VIFHLYDRLVIKLGDDERHVYDRNRLMYTEVAEMERVTGLSYAEWHRELGRHSITAIAALLHVLRKREGIPSDFATMQFNAASMDCVPVHDDGSEYTPAEIAADMLKRMEAARTGPGPTRGGEGSAVTAEAPVLEATTVTSPSSPPATGSAHGNGNGSRGRTSASSRRTPTHT